MKHTLQKRLANLISVKSLVTLILTLTFAVLTLRGSVSGQDFLTIFSIVIAFYFGTQNQKTSAGDEGTAEETSARPKPEAAEGEQHAQ